MSIAAFDAFGFARRLRDIGVEPQRAEMEAQALGDAFMGQNQALTSLETRFAALQHAGTEAASKADVAKVDAKVDQLRADMDRRLAELELRLTLRLGGIVAAGIAATAALAKFF